GQTVNRMALLNVPKLPQRTDMQNVPVQTPTQQSSKSSAEVANNNESLTVTTTSSAEVRQRPGQAAPRLSALPTELAPQETAKQESTKTDNVKVDVSAAPKVTMARTAALPKEDTVPEKAPLPTAPQSTVAASHAPDTALAASSATHAPQCLAMANDALSMPAHKTAPAPQSKTIAKSVASKAAPAKSP